MPRLSGADAVVGVPHLPGASSRALFFIRRRRSVRSVLRLRTGTISPRIVLVLGTVGLMIAISVNLFLEHRARLSPPPAC
jgi:hypothetical protein